jgi:ankyrin repeat protein
MIIYFLIIKNRKVTTEDLFEASQDGNLNNVMKILDSYNFNINSQNESGWTSLMFAAALGHEDIVKYLIDKGADANIKNKDNKTASMIIEEKNFPYNKILEYLKTNKKES